MISSDPHLFSIGEIAAMLRPEFEISASNLRFWEKEGLIVPHRTAGGHRLYSSADADLIRLIKRLHDGRHIPLARIKQILDAAGGEVPLLESALRPQHYDPTFIPLTAAGLAAETGLTATDVAALVQHGVLGPCVVGDDDSPLYDEDDRELCRHVASFLAAGIGLAGVLTKATLIRDLVRAEWDTILEPLLCQLPALPVSTGMVLKAKWEEAESLLFRKSRQRLHGEVIRTVARHPACLPPKE